MEKKEVIIGTDENEIIDSSIGSTAGLRNHGHTRVHGEEKSRGDDQNINSEGEEEEEPIEPVPIADMEIHLSRIRQAILLSSSPGVQPDELYFQNAEIEVGEIERVELLDDLLDTVMYWATEESSTFLDLPSQLAHVEAPEVMSFCIFSQRPRIIAKALTIILLMMEHVQTLSELHRCIQSYYRYYCSISTHTLHQYCIHHELENKERGGSEISYFLRAVVYLLHQYEGLPELVASATRVATKLCLVEGAEKVLYSGSVGLVLSSMVNHMESRSVHLSSVEFFSSTVGLPREESPPGETEMEHQAPVPLAVLYCYADELLPLLTQTFRLGWTNLEIKKHCLSFIKVCFRFPENRLVLVQSQALLLALKALSELYRSAPELIEDALDIISYAIPYLDTFQRRSILRVLAQILHFRGEVNVLLRAVAVTYGLLRAAQNQQRQEKQHNDHLLETRKQERENNSDSLPTEKQQSMKGGKKNISSKVRLEWSTIQWHPSAEDTIAYVHDLYFPQLLIHIADFYLPVYRRKCEENEGDSENSDQQGEEEENKEEKQLGELARKCVQELMTSVNSVSPGDASHPYWFA